MKTRKYLYFLHFSGTIGKILSYFKRMWEVIHLFKENSDTPDDFNINDHTKNIILPDNDKSATSILKNSNDEKKVELCMAFFKEIFPTENCFTAIRTCIGRLKKTEILFQAQEIAHHICTVHSISPEEKRVLLFLEDQIFQFLLFYKKEQQISTKIKKKINSLLNMFKK